MNHSWIKTSAIIITLLLSVSSIAAKELTVEASQQKKLYIPVWIEKGSTVTFRVKGAWSMWHPSWGMVNYRGHTSFRKTNGHHLGTLMGCVEGGESFTIEDNMKFVSPVSGYLMLYPHRHGLQAS